MFAQPENEWVREWEREREREGRWYKGSYSPCAFHEILSLMGSVERKILKSIPGVWGRSLTPARMRTNSNCMAMMLIWVSHSAWNGNKESRAGWGGWADRHAYVNMGFADLWISNNGVISSPAIEVRSCYLDSRVSTCIRKEITQSVSVTLICSMLE